MLVRSGLPLTFGASEGCLSHLWDIPYQPKPCWLLNQKTIKKIRFYQTGFFVFQDLNQHICIMSSSSIQQIQQEVIEEFELFDDWTDRYEYIIDLGKKIPPLPENFKTEENLIKGCQSKVWLVSRFEDGLLYFDADSDAIIVKGLVGLLIRVLSGHKPKEIASADLFFIDKIGMTRHLAQTRSSGLLSMVKQIKYYALAYQARLHPDSPQIQS